MRLWQSIRRMWSRRDEDLAETEVEGEATGVALEGFSEKAVHLTRVDQADPLDDGVERE